MKTIRPYQEKAITEMLEHYHNGHNTCLVSMVGSGKTFMAHEFVARLLKDKPKLSIATAVHTIEIKGQLEDVFEDLPQVEHYTIQYLSRHPELQFDLLIIDESQHALSNSYRKVIAENTKLHIGLSGTIVSGVLPTYPDEIKLTPNDWKLSLTGFVGTGIYDKFVLTLDPVELIEQGYLTEYEMIHDFDFHMDLQSINNSRDYTKTEIDHNITVDEIVQYVQHSVGDKSAIVFCHSIEYADKVAEKLGDCAVSLHSKIDKQERAYLMNAFRNKEKKILCGVNAFNEGVDVPNLEAVYLMRPTRSFVTYIQQIGRALRTDPNNPTKVAKIYDYVNNKARIGCEIKDVKLSDMLLTGKFVKEICEYCGNHSVVTGKTDKLVGSVTNTYVRSLTNWLSDNKDCWTFKLSTDSKKVTVELLNDSLPLDIMLEYIELFHKVQFTTYVFPTIKNQYGRWEVMNPRNLPSAIDRKHSRVLEVMGSCKFSNELHPYFIIEDNLKPRRVSSKPKIKK